MLQQKDKVEGANCTETESMPSLIDNTENETEKVSYSLNNNCQLRMEHPQKMFKCRGSDIGGVQTLK